MRNTIFCLFALLTTGCVIVPGEDVTKINRCEISSDRKTLKIVNGFEDSNTFYSVSGLILLPLSGIISGTYVAVNNIYHLGEERIICGSKDDAHVGMVEKSSKV